MTRDCLVWRAAFGYGFALFLMRLLVLSPESWSDYPAGVYRACADIVQHKRDVLLEAAAVSHDQGKGRLPTTPAMRPIFCSNAAADAVRITGGPDSYARSDQLEEALERSFPRPWRNQ